MNTTNFTTIQSSLASIQSEFAATEVSKNTLSTTNATLTTNLSAITAERDALKTTISQMKSAPSVSATSTVQTIFIPNGTDLDSKIRDIKSKATDVNVKIQIKLDAGVFKTNGIAPGLNWDISGAGIDLTTLILNDVGDKGFHAPNNYIIATANYGGSDPSWNNVVRVADMTLDANWQNQTARTVVAYKYGGVYLQASDITIERIKVINWGSNGINVDYSEAFPIFGVTYSSETSHVLIQDCIVEKQFLYNGGYATAVMVQTMQPGAGDRIPYGTRKSESALVRRNQVYGVVGHGYGCGFSENVLFDNNICIDSKTGVNIDTGNNRNIKFTNNKFLLCTQGIHFGNAYSFTFDDFVIKNNYFMLSTPFYNAFTSPPMSEFVYGIRASGNTHNTNISGNRIRSGCKLSEISQGIYGIGLAGVNVGMTVGTDNVYEGITVQNINNPSQYV